MPKKSFKEDVQGADKLFSVNDAPKVDSEQTAEVTETPEQQAESIVLDNTSNNIYSNIEPNIKSNVLTNILDSIKSEEPAGANHTFYLSAETAAAVAATAKKKKISRSKLVDTILKQVLLAEV